LTLILEQAEIEDIIYSTEKNQYLKRIPNAPGVYSRCHQNQKYVESMHAFRTTPSNKHILNAPGIYIRWLQKFSAFRLFPISRRTGTKDIEMPSVRMPSGCPLHVNKLKQKILLCSYNLADGCIRVIVHIITELGWATSTLQMKHNVW
jgi:hypothetical protein